MKYFHPESLCITRLRSATNPMTIQIKRAYVGKYGWTWKLKCIPISLSFSAVSRQEPDSGPPPQSPRQMGLMKCCVSFDLDIFLLPDVKLPCHKHISQIKSGFLCPVRGRSGSLHATDSSAVCRANERVALFTFLRPSPNSALECRCTLSVSAFDKSSAIWLPSLLRAEKAVDKHCRYWVTLLCTDVKLIWF